MVQRGLIYTHKFSDTNYRIQTTVRHFTSWIKHLLKWPLPTFITKGFNRFTFYVNYYYKSPISYMSPMIFNFDRMNFVSFRRIYIKYCQFSYYSIIRSCEWTSSFWLVTDFAERYILLWYIGGIFFVLTFDIRILHISSFNATKGISLLYRSLF